MNPHLENRRYMMAVVFALMTMAPGMWFTSLPNILVTYDARWVLPYAVALGPIGALLSTLFFGSLSDRKMNAEKLLGILGMSGAVFLWLAFSSLKWGWHPGWYLFFQGINAMISGPMFALITKVKLSNLPNAEKSFPIYSMFGTVGWMVGGWLISWFGYDRLADAGITAAYVRVLMGSLCFLLPATPPKDLQSKGWKASLGLTAFGLLKTRELRVFYLATTMVGVPLVAFGMFLPILLVEFGSKNPTAQMTFGQMLELFAMLLLSVAAGRLRVRWFVLAGLSLVVVRSVILAVASELAILPLIWAGISLHGPIYTFLFVTGRMYLDKRVPESMRGQAQALFHLLVMSLGGIVGAFACNWLYQWLVGGDREGWPLYWWALAAVSLIPLVYFATSVIKPRSAAAPDQKSAS